MGYFDHFASRVFWISLKSVPHFVSNASSSAICFFPRVMTTVLGYGQLTSCFAISSHREVSVPSKQMTVLKPFVASILALHLLAIFCLCLLS